MKFTLYSKEGCSYCKKAERLLELAKVEYRVYKLDIDFTKDQFIAEFGYGASFPSCLLYTSPSPRDVEESRMPSSA